MWAAWKSVLCLRNCFLSCIRLHLVPCNSLSRPDLSFNSKMFRKCFHLIPFFLVRNLHPTLNPRASAFLPWSINPTTLCWTENPPAVTVTKHSVKQQQSIFWSQWCSRKEKQGNIVLLASPFWLRLPSWPHTPSCPPPWKAEKGDVRCHSGSLWIK